MTFVFAVLMIIVFGKLFEFALRAAWGITKIFFSVLFLPLTIIGLFVGGLIHVAFVLLLCVGIFSLLGSFVRAC